MNNSDRPAMPVLHTIDGNWVKEPLDEFKGLTKREHFAAMAMQGYIARGHDLEMITRDSIDTADALLKELEA